MRPLPKPRPGEPEEGPQEVLSLSRVRLSELRSDRRTTACDGQAGRLAPGAGAGQAAREESGSEQGGQLKVEQQLESEQPKQQLESEQQPQSERQSGQQQQRLPGDCTRSVPVTDQSEQSNGSDAIRIR